VLKHINYTLLPPVNHYLHTPPYKDTYRLLSPPLNNPPDIPPSQYFAKPITTMGAKCPQYLTILYT
jgi:hypothetical protein